MQRLWLASVLTVVLAGWAGTSPAQSPTAAQLAAGLADLSPRTAEQAAWLLEQVGTEPARAVPLLAELLRYKPHALDYGPVRAAAALALKRLSLPALGQALGSAHRRVRDAAATMLTVAPSHAYWHPDGYVHWADEDLFKKVGLRPKPTARELLEGLESDEAAGRAVCLAALRSLRQTLAPPETTPVRSRQLLEALRSRNPTIRRGAVLGLRDREPRPDAVVRIVDALRDEHPLVRRAAAELLGDIQSPNVDQNVLVEALTRALEDRDVRVQAEAIDALRRQFESGASPAALLRAEGDALHAQLLERLRDAASPLVRAAAARALGVVWPGEGTPVAALVKALKDPHVAVRWGAVQSLGTLGARARQAAPTLVRLLDDEDETVRAAAAGALGAAGEASKPLVRALGQVLADPQPMVRSRALASLRRFGGRARPALPAIAARLEDPVASIRWGAVHTLRAMEPPSREAARALVRALDDEDYSVRWWAVETLGRYGPVAADTVAELVPLLADTQPRIRRITASTLGRIGPAAVPDLFGAWPTARPEHEAAFEEAVTHLGVHALGPLEELLGSPVADCRCKALAAIARLGPGAASLVPAVVERLDDEAPAARVLAAAALARIGPAAVHRLARAWHDGPARVRPRVAGALRGVVREHGPTAAAAAETLLAMLRDGSPPVQEHAADGLAHVWRDPDEAGRRLAGALAVDRQLPTDPKELAALLDAERAGRRLLAACALASTGEDGLPVLTACLRSGRPRRRTAAAWALSLAGGKAPGRLLDALRNAYGIAVEINDEARFHDPGFFPRDLWHRAHAGRLPEAARPQALALVVEALARYPAALVAAHVRGIKLASTLSFDGLSYGGTLHRGVIYLAAGPRPNGHLVDALHHELSSAFMRRHEFPAGKWRAANPPDFHYGRGGRHAIWSGQVGLGSPRLFEQGFFKPYAQADIENDFNVFSETILAHPAWARELLPRYPRLAAKWKVWIAFYHRLDPTLTAERVLGLGQ